MKDRFHHCLNTCKSLDCASLVNSSTQKAIENISADKLIYNYAIEMCQSAALEELFGRAAEVMFILELFIYGNITNTNLFFILIYNVLVLSTLSNGTNTSTQFITTSL